MPINDESLIDRHLINTKTRFQRFWMVKLVFSTTGGLNLLYREINFRCQSTWHSHLSFSFFQRTTKIDRDQKCWLGLTIQKSFCRPMHSNGYPKLVSSWHCDLIGVGNEKLMKYQQVFFFASPQKSMHFMRIHCSQFSGSKNEYF